MTINFREPSTKRGIVMTITGCIVLYQLFSGSEVSIDALLAKVEWWIGIGITLAGLLGLLPDTPPRSPTLRERASDQSPVLPPIELVGRAESRPPRRALDSTSDDRSVIDRCSESVRVADELRDTVPSERSDENGWNG